VRVAQRADQNGVAPRGCRRSASGDRDARAAAAPAQPERQVEPESRRIDGIGRRGLARAEPLPLAPTASVNALAMGGICALISGAVTGALIAIGYNLFGRRTVR